MCESTKKCLKPAVHVELALVCFYDPSMVKADVHLLCDDFPCKRSYLKLVHNTPLQLLIIAHVDQGD